MLQSNQKARLPKIKIIEKIYDNGEKLKATILVSQRLHSIIVCFKIFKKREELWVNKINDRMNATHGPPLYFSLRVKPHIGLENNLLLHQKNNNNNNKKPKLLAPLYIGKF